MVTDDGYLLEMHRVFDDYLEGVTRPVLFLQHGLSASSESFMLNGSNSAAYIFARLGYDVWLGNNRGN